MGWKFINLIHQVIPPISSRWESICDSCSLLRQEYILVSYPSFTLPVLFLESLRNIFGFGLYKLIFNIVTFSASFYLGNISVYITVYFIYSPTLFRKLLFLPQAWPRHSQTGHSENDTSRHCRGIDQVLLCVLISDHVLKLLSKYIFFPIILLLFPTALAIDYAFTHVSEMIFSGNHEYFIYLNYQINLLLNG